MITDVFVLLQDARARITSNVAAIEARRDYFIARVDLEAAMLSGKPAGVSMQAAAPEAAPTHGGGH
jgi:hypothetical protein